jgi:hypothetical protein
VEERAVAAIAEEEEWSTIALQQANLAGMFVDAGRSDEAAVAIGRASEAVHGHGEHPGVRAHVATVDSLVESALGHGDAAEQRALEAGRLRGPHASAEQAARTEIALGRARLERGNLAGALAALNAAVEHREQAYGHRHSMVVKPLELRSQARALLGDEQGAVEDASRAAAIRDAVRASR